MKGYIFESIDRYYKALSIYGYKNYGEVLKLLFQIIIDDFTSKDFRGFLSPNDYKHIERAMYCIWGTCVLPYPKFYDKRIHNEQITSWDYFGARTSHIRDRGRDKAHQAPCSPPFPPPPPPPYSSFPLPPRGLGDGYTWPDRFGLPYGRRDWRRWLGRWGYKRGSTRHWRRCRHHFLTHWHHLTEDARKQIHSILKEEYDKRQDRLREYWFERDERQ